MSLSVSRVRVDGPLARWAPGFVAELEGLRYAPSSAHQQVKMLARLSGWLAGEGLDAWDLTPVVVARFVAELRGSGYRNPRSWRGLGTVLGYLRSSAMRAVELLHEGIPLPLIQRQLGHSHLSTTG